jgi:hypothetical protein
MRLRYLKAVKLKVQIAAKAFKSKDEQQQEAVVTALAEAAEMSAHAFDKTIMLLVALIQGATCTYLADYHQA